MAPRQHKNGARDRKTAVKGPKKKYLRFEKKYRNLSVRGEESYATRYVQVKKFIAGFFEAEADGRDGKLAANWVTGELFGALNKVGKSITESPVTAAQVGTLIDRVSDGTLSVRLAKEVFEFMFESGRDADDLIEEKGLKQVTDSGAIEAVIDQVMTDNPEKVEEYRAGRDKLMGWFVGQVMKASQGKANPAAVNKALSEKLKG